MLRLERAQGGRVFGDVEISSDTDSGSEELFGAMENMNEVTVRIAMTWLYKVRAEKPKMQNGLRLDISSDDSEEEDEPAVEYDFVAPVMSQASIKIAFRWLRSIRVKMKIAKGEKPMLRADISSDSGEEDGQYDISDDSGEDAVGAGEAPELQDPRTQAVAYKWLSRVRRTERKAAWELEVQEIVEDVKPKQRIEKKKVGGKR